MQILLFRMEYSVPKRYHIKKMTVPQIHMLQESVATQVIRLRNKDIRSEVEVAPTE